MPEDLYDSIPISEDEIVINLRFNVIFCESQPFLSFQEEWVIKPIKNHFENYNFNNSIRMNAIEILNNETLLFDFKQINPDISLEEIVENINSNLEEVFEPFNIEIKEDFWKTIEIYSIGDKEDALKQANEYLKRIKNENGKDNSDNNSH